MKLGPETQHNLRFQIIFHLVRTIWDDPHNMKKNRYQLLVKGQGNNNLFSQYHHFIIKEICFEYNSVIF